MKLKDISHYVIDKISSDSINLNQYVTTDSLLQNKAGKENATNLPPQRCLLTHFQKGDILIANIRPYLKKIWQADHDGACNADVLVLRANKQSDSDYLFALLLQNSFYDYVMQGAKGSKMPRGDKNQIMEYEFLQMDSSEREQIGCLFSNIKAKIDSLKAINRNLSRSA